MEIKDEKSFLQNSCQKWEKICKIYDTWLQIKNLGMSIAKYLEYYNYKAVSIYGFDMLGKRLYQELTNDNIRVINVLDVNADYSHSSDAGFVNSIKNMASADIVIVTEIVDFAQTEKKLRECGHKNIIAFEEILDGLLNMKIETETKKPDVFIWGMGKYLQTVLQSMDENKYVLKAFVDSDKNKTKIGRYAQYQILTPEEAFNLKYDYIVVSIQNYQTIKNEKVMQMFDKERMIYFWDKEDKSVNNVSFIHLIKRENLLLQLELQDCKERLNNLPYEINDRLSPIIHPATELLDLMIKNGSSLCRFGDGEFEAMRKKKSVWFQDANSELADRLNQVFNSNNEKIIIAIADNLGNLDKYCDYAAKEIRNYLDCETRKALMDLIGRQREYYDAYVSRPYLMYRDKNIAVEIFNKFKQLFEGRDLLIVEGKYVRNGINNDLFRSSSSVRRIICPEKNSFDKYNKILCTVQKHANKSDLILISLGQTATVLAYDLAMMGFQAIDFGQLDNEYEWYLRGAKIRIAIPGKSVPELSWCHSSEALEDGEYESQIVSNLCD